MQALRDRLTSSRRAQNSINRETVKGTRVSFCFRGAESSCLLALPQFVKIPRFDEAESSKAVRSDMMIRTESTAARSATAQDGLAGVFIGAMDGVSVWSKPKHPAVNISVELQRAGARYPTSGNSKPCDERRTRSPGWHRPEGKS
jgi:hypothetical protein